MSHSLQFHSDTPSDDVSEHHSRRALVLAGGGAAGNAWELGLIAGLSDAGVDVTDADLIVGTSAGSTVAAQITSGARPAELYAAVLAEVLRPQGAEPRSDGGRASSRPGPSYMEWSTKIIESAEDASGMRRRMGAAALEMDAPTAPVRRAGAISSQLGFRAIIGRSSPCSSSPRTRARDNRLYSIGTAESIWWTPSPRAPRR